MALIITEEQQMLKTSTKELLKDKGSIANLRKLRDDNDPIGFDRNLWNEMAEMGLASLTIPEAYGGLDFGYTGLGQVLEETGRTLTASPLVSTVLLSSTAINLGGNVMQKKQLLPEIAEGKIVIGFANEEGRHHAPNLVKTTAILQGDNYVINGTKKMVLDGHVADKFIVVARTTGAANQKEGIELFVVDANTEGITTERVIMMDSRNSAIVHFKDVKVPRSSKLDEFQNGGYALLEKTLDIARIGLAAEMLGGITEAFERTITYLKERQQFGVIIGTFQALQHRAAKMFCEIELCKSIVIKGLKAIDSDSPDLRRLASLAKAKLGETYRLVSNEGIQMFGGIGMTDEEEIGFFLKRARVVQQTLGDTNFHLNRLALMRGF